MPSTIRRAPLTFVEPLENRLVLSTLVGTGLYKPTQLEVFNGNVYFTDQTFNALPSDTSSYLIKEVSTSGGTPKTLVSGLPQIETYAIDSTGVYGDYGGPPSDIVFTVPTGKAAKELGTIGDAFYGLDSGKLIYTNTTPSYALYSLPETGGTHTPINALFEPQAEVVDGNNIDYVDNTTESVEVINLTSGVITDLTPNFHLETDNIFADANNIYVQADSGALYSVSKANGTITQLLENGAPKAFCSDGTEIYLNDDNALGEMSVNGGPVSVLATLPTDLQELVSVTQSGSFVYYTGALVPSDVFPKGASGAIYRVAKNEPGGIAVTARTVANAAAAGDTVELFNSKGKLLVKHTTSSTGTATFSNEAVGTYTVELLDSSGDLWATASTTVNAGATTSLKIVQNEPHETGLKVVNSKTGKTVTGTTITKGTALTIDMDVQNSIKAKEKSKVTLKLLFSSKDKVAETVTSAVESLASDGSLVFKFSYTPAVTGTFLAEFDVLTLVGSAYVDTDAGKISSIFTSNA